MTKLIQYSIEGNENFLEFGEILSQCYPSKYQNLECSEYKIGKTHVLIDKIGRRVVISGENIDQVEEIKFHLEEITDLELIDLMN